MFDSGWIGVRVRAQAARRLRVAGRDHVVRRGQRAERVQARRAADGLDRLGEDVVGQRVVGDRVGRGDVERAVARGAPGPQAGGRVQAGALGGDADPDVALTCRKCSCDWNQSTSWSHWLLTFIHSATTVPLNFAARRGTAHDDARAVRVSGAQDGGRVGAGDRVARGLTRDEVLLLDVARLREVDVGGQERVAVRRVTDRRRARDRTGDGRRGHGGAGGGGRARRFAVGTGWYGAGWCGQARCGGQCCEQHRGADAYGQLSPSKFVFGVGLFGPWLHVSSHGVKVSRTNSTVGRTNSRLCCSIACLPSGTDR